MKKNQLFGTRLLTTVVYDGLLPICHSTDISTALALGYISIYGIYLNIVYLLIRTQMISIIQIVYTVYTD